MSTLEKANKLKIELTDEATDDEIWKLDDFEDNDNYSFATCVDRSLCLIFEIDADKKEDPGDIVLRYNGVVVYDNFSIVPGSGKEFENIFDAVISVGNCNV